MSAAEVLLLAVALAADAFSVAVSVGLALGRLTGRQVFRLAWHFGFFQFMMPVVGWAAGRTFVAAIEGYDHWVALALLAYVGGKMIWESLKPEEERDRTRDPTRGASLVVLSVATSVDALAVGLTMAMLKTTIWLPCVVIGVVAGGLTVAGMTLGRRIGAVVSRRVEAVGGGILILIGLRIVGEHLGLL